MKVSLCQLVPVIGDAEANAERIASLTVDSEADIIVFPEMFLTDYTFRDFDSVSGSIGPALKRIREVCSDRGKTVVAGGPHMTDEGVHNSAYVISDSIQRYDKINLPDFEPFSEKRTFVPGVKPLTFDAGRYRFGVAICYDIFFPELTKTYAMNGADAVICLSASPVTSKVAFERVLPARSVETTMYTLFCNNTGMRGSMKFFGKSRCLAPNGDIVAIAGHDESVTTVRVCKEIIEKARRQRPTIEDTRLWMENRMKGADKRF